jgi:hypothetical protein
MVFLTSIDIWGGRTTCGIAVPVLESVQVLLAFTCIP